MQRAVDGVNSSEGGIQIHGATVRENATAKFRFLRWLKDLGLQRFVRVIDEPSATGRFLCFQLRLATQSLAPLGDTTGLCRQLNLDTVGNPRDLECEIVLSMLLCPVPFQFPTFDELRASVRIRKQIVQAARKTALAFAAYEAERPETYWRYDEDFGFVLRPGQCLIEALEHATQPEISGKRYTFSCRRAVEYIVLLSLAHEAKRSHTELFAQLHQQAERRALKGRDFESTFLRPFGSLHNPLPVKFFIPGDRTWFRNPDPASSEVTGYEGSWTFYLGNGVFADFWRKDKLYSLTSKCITIYHWRNALLRDEQGEWQIDEERVEQLVDETLKDPAATDRILKQMLQLQDPVDRYAGGCIEPHREYVRQVCRGTSDLTLPDITAAVAATTLSN